MAKGNVARESYDGNNDKEGIDNGSTLDVPDRINPGYFFANGGGGERQVWNLRLGQIR